MGIIDAAKRFLTLDTVHPPPIATRSIDSFVDHPGLTEQLLAIQGLNARPWRAPSVRDALGVPSIYRAVSLIANTTGALTLEAYRKGLRLPADERPRIIVRPDPFRKPRDFFRDTAWNMATRGEAWWWIAKRDADGNALSLLNIAPAEVMVTEDPRDPRYPIIEWRGRRMPFDDMRQITLNRDEGLRGIGPLQVCKAALSVAVEAQEWAANFFAAGGYPNIWIKAAGELGGSDDGMSTEEQLEAGAVSEAQRLKNDWISTAPNTPKVTDEGILDIKQFDPNPQGAQMLDAREHQNGDAARMFGIPASLLDHTTPGSNLTYQNLEQEYAKFVRGCLWPNYLEAIEQEMSDLLTRSTVARFNVDALQRADIKTRYEVYKLGTDAGVMDPDEARRIEGLEAGDIENAPVPLAPLVAIPTSIPARSTEVRCDGMRTFRRSGVTKLDRCNTLLAERGPFVGTCRKCKKQYAAA